MAINKAGQNNTSPAVELADLFFIAFDPCVAQDIPLTPDADDFSSAAQHSSIFNQCNVIQSGTSPWRRRSAKSEELANVGQQQVMGFLICSLSLQLKAILLHSKIARRGECQNVVAAA